MHRFKPLLFPVALLAIVAALLMRTASIQAAPSSCSGWSLVSNPNPSTSSDNLVGVSASSTSNAWAIGDYSSNQGIPTLHEHWNGSQWNVIAPSATPSTPYLSAVATLSPTNTWAVGDYDANGNGLKLSLIEHWDGTSWSVVPSPTPSPTFNYLSAVTSLSAKNIWAVGDFNTNNDTSTKTLIEHWNGTRWKVIASPNSPLAVNQLTAVTAINAHDIWAVGYAQPSGASPINTLTEHWDGTRWSIVPSPSPSAFSNYLYGITAIASNNVWAVGNFYDTRSVSLTGTLVEHWDGTKWAVIPSTNVISSNGTNTLSAVTASSANAIWAVGNSSDFNAQNPQPMIEMWNGTKWSIVNGPTVGSGGSLYSVTRVPGSNQAWAVGTYITSTGGSQSFIERYC